MLTVCIPVGPNHLDKVGRAIKSVAAQSVPVQALIGIDHDANGPGYVRNVLTHYTKTPYITFLDADDWIEPTFAERTLATIAPGSYVYTDWYADTAWISAPAKPWSQAFDYHVVTTLLHTDHVKAVGGFDMELSAMEDTDFYLKLLRSGFKPLHLKEPLFNYYYGGSASRSHTAHRTGYINEARKIVSSRHRGHIMSCCSERIATTQPLNTPQEGFVLARAQWQGNRHVSGVYSGIRYPRMSYPRTAYIHPLDAKHDPHSWYVLPTDTGDKQANIQSFGNMIAQAVSRLEIENNVTVAHIDYSSGGIERVLKVAKDRLNAS